MKVKRVLAVCAFSVLISLYLLITAPRVVFYILLASFLPLIAAHRLVSDEHTGALLLCLASALAAFAYLNIYNSVTGGKIRYLAGRESCVIDGTVIEVSSSSAAKYYTVKLKKADGHGTGNISVRIYTDRTFDIGDRICATGRFSRLSPKGNYLYSYSKGVFGYFRAEDIRSETPQFSVYRRFYNLRRSLVSMARRLYDVKTVGVVCAMGLGDKSLLRKDIVNDISFTGISHAFTVSGLHVGFITLAAGALLSLFPIRKKTKNIVLSVVTFVFMGIAGFTPSVIRAGALVIASLIGRNFFLEIDGYTVLAAVLFVTLALNPYSRADGGLLLSYSAYFGVIRAAGISVRNGYGRVRTALLITVFAMLFTSPVTAALGMGNTLFSPLFNLLLGPAVMAVCVLSFFTPVLGYIPVISQLFNPALVLINKLLISLVLSCASFASEKLGFAMVNMGGERVKALIAIAIFCAARCFLLVRGRRNVKIFLSVVPLSLFLCYNFLSGLMVTVTAFDSGSETGLIVREKGKNYLFLGEPADDEDAEEILATAGADIFDCVFYFPEKDGDIYSGLPRNREEIRIYGDGAYRYDGLSLCATVAPRNMVYRIEAGGKTFLLNHKRAKMGDVPADFYFFGSDTPDSVAAENCFYFYPLLKKHAEMSEELSALPLYGPLTVKILPAAGICCVVKDVKNFGFRL